MNELMKILGQTGQAMTFDQIRISIASPEQIRSWSYGEIKTPEMINDRTFKPERDGLFCARIFGPIKDNECLCGKYKRMKFRGIICEKCGVEVTLARVRRERMGHIELASPVAHIWFMKSLPSRVGLMVDMSLKELEKVLYFESYVVLEPGLTDLELHQLLTEDQLQSKQDEFGDDAFSVGIGAEAVKQMLAAIDVGKEAPKLRADLKDTTSEAKRKKLVKRLKMLEAFAGSAARPEWMILDVVPVIPPDLRPLVPLDGVRFATSDLNDLYRRVINRNNRLKRLIELRAPDILVRNEKRMLQEAVDALFDNGRRGRAITGANKRPLKSLSDMLNGKEGRFRQNLLGKRVDYSGRSVIIVGPELKLHQCGIPRPMALELFRPFVYRELEKMGLVDMPDLQDRLRAYRMIVARKPTWIWDIVEKVIRGHPVLLNRAPTLHRLGIQAFEPVLVEGKAIQLHPLVCTAFNADFDGDQMAVHVPLSLEAQLEARVLMMSTNNILSPANGKPIIVPSQDIVLGLYYLSIETPEFKATGEKDAPTFASMGEIEHALAVGAIKLHSKIRARRKTMDKDGNIFTERVVTTAGRMMIGALFPLHQNLPYSLLNRLLTKKNISDVIDAVYRHCGQKESVIFADRLMGLGFRNAARAGISFGKDDMVIPDSKGAQIQTTKDQVKEFEQQYLDGLITAGERYNKLVDAWSRCTEEVAQAMMKEIMKQEAGKPTNSVWMMSHSGARGSPAQMRQLAGMRGLMAKPSGEIIEQPIISNFKEGLTVLEYFNSTHGARKGLADTALKTANSGYLTRRLVDVAQDCIIVEDDCGTERGFTMRAVMDGGEAVSSLSECILGRTTQEDILDPATGEVLVPRNHLIEETDAEKVEKAGVEAVKIRSVLTCDSRVGVCGHCYGRDLARGTPVNVGEAVGIIAAQSIGEPGTQLTMRTWLTGGVARLPVEPSAAKAAATGQARFVNCRSVTNSHGATIVMSRNCEAVVYDTNGRERGRLRVPYGARLLTVEGERVTRGQNLAEWDPFTLPIITEQNGKMDYADLIENITLMERTDEVTGLSFKEVVEYKQSGRGADLRPRLILRDERGNVVKRDNGSEAITFLPPGSLLSTENGKEVFAGDVIARTPRESSTTRDITGGLPRVAELFEARRPKDAAIIAHVDGRVEFGKDYKAKRRILVVPDQVPGTDEPPTPREYLVPKGKHVSVQEGDYVKAGDPLVDGPRVPHDILRVLGVEALANYLVNEIQDVYRLKGVKINDKHIEVIVRQMLQKVEIIDAGDTTYLVGETVERIEFEIENEKRIAAKERPARAEPVLQGITKASLQTTSFISAASFQETTRVLIEAATAGKVDDLAGLKENVIVGRLIPAGTGSVVNRLRAVAAQPDRGRIPEAPTPLPEPAWASLDAASARDGRGETFASPASMTRSSRCMRAG